MSIAIWRPRALVLHRKPNLGFISYQRDGRCIYDTDFIGYSFFYMTYQTAPMCYGSIICS